MRTPLTVAVPLAAVLLTACSGQAGTSSKSSTESVKTVSLNKLVLTAIDTEDIIHQMSAGAEVTSFETPCKSVAGFVAAGDEVVIRDSDERVVAEGHLGPGLYGNDEGGNSIPLDEVPCVFEFTIANVPLADHRYEVRIGDNTPVEMTRMELANSGEDIVID